MRKPAAHTPSFLFVPTTSRSIHQPVGLSTIRKAFKLIDYLDRHNRTLHVTVPICVLEYYHFLTLIAISCNTIDATDFPSLFLLVFVSPKP